jgi:hypothetical protein
MCPIKPEYSNPRRPYYPMAPFAVVGTPGSYSLTNDMKNNAGFGLLDHQQRGTYAVSRISAQVEI